MQQRTNDVINKVKIWLFPSIISICTALIMRDLSELKSDVKQLLAQSNIDKTKIDNLESDVKALEQVVFFKKVSMNWHLPTRTPMVFKHEEEFDVKKYLPKKV